MNLTKKVMQQIKESMKTKDVVALETLRAIKSSILLEQTKFGAQKELNEEQEIKLLQKLHKQRKEAAEIYRKQNRDDLAKNELDQAEIVAGFLPKPMGQEELDDVVKNIISKVGASTPKDMGKVMSVASKELIGKADGKSISETVKKILSQEKT